MNNECNVSVIPDEYSELRKEYIALKKELDVIKQELYAAKRNLQVLEALKNDYQNEVDLLQSNMDGRKKLLEDKIIHLEDTNNTLKLKFSDRIQCLEQDLLKYEEENLSLKNEVEMLRKSNTAVNNDRILNKLDDEILNLREENSILIDSIEELKESLEILHKQNLVLSETISESQYEIDELKNSLACKKEELLDANEMVDKVNVELITLKNELETYKNKSAAKCAQGNSLFAEVDDRRVYLQKTINNMKQEYMAMKQERARHLREIHHLKIENKKVLERWKADINEKDDDHYTELKSLKGRIGILENLLEGYQNDLKAKEIAMPKDSFEGYEFYSVMIQNKNKQIEELRQQLSSRTLTEILLSKALNDSNEEKRKWKLEVSMKQNELQLLRVDTEKKEEKAPVVKSNLTESNLVKDFKLEEVEHEHNPKAGILKITQTCKVTKLKEMEDLFSKNNNGYEFNSKTQTENNHVGSSHETPSPNQNITNNVIEIERDEDVSTNSISDDDSSIENTEECDADLENQSSDKSNSTVILLDDDSSEEDSLLNETNISSELSIKREEDEIEYSQLKHVEAVEENKENVDIRDNINAAETTKKVTFSANTVSPKTTELGIFELDQNRTFSPQQEQVPTSPKTIAS